MFGAFNTFGKLGAPAGGKTLLAQILAMQPSFVGIPSVTNGYQDSAGTTALTQPGGGSADPPVGKALDLSGLGNHAIQATSTARPKLSARVNLLTYTEDFSNGVWGIYLGPTKIGAAPVAGPDGAAAYEFSMGAVGGAGVASAGAVFYTLPSGASGNNTWSVYVRAKTGTSSIRTSIYLSAGVNVGTADISISDAFWTRIQLTRDFGAASASNNVSIRNNVAGNSGNIYVTEPQLETGSTATRYQRVTDANNYDYSGFPLIHQFDAVDDAHVVTFGSSLGSDCTVVTANRGTTPTIQTGQTIGTSYTITTTHAGKLIFPRALTAAETAIVTAWATKQGAIA